MELANLAAPLRASAVQDAAAPPAVKSAVGVVSTAVKIAVEFRFPDIFQVPYSSNVCYDFSKQIYRSATA